MVGMSPERFPISFSRFNRVLMLLLAITPARSYVDVRSDVVECHLAWAFHALIPRSAVRSPRPAKRVYLTAGAHGWRGRWLVNGKTTGLMEFDVDPPVRARLLGLQIIRLRTLVVSVDDVAGLIAVLGGPS